MLFIISSLSAIAVVRASVSIPLPSLPVGEMLVGNSFSKKESHQRCPTDDGLSPVFAKIHLIQAPISQDGYITGKQMEKRRIRL
jgi:hypothetical protein